MHHLQAVFRRFQPASRSHPNAPQGQGPADAEAKGVVPPGSPESAAVVRWHGRLPADPPPAGRARARPRPAEITPLWIPPRTQATLHVTPTPTERAPAAAAPAVAAMEGAAAGIRVEGKHGEAWIRPRAPGPAALPEPARGVLSQPATAPAAAQTAALTPLAPEARGLPTEAQVARLLAVAESRDLLALRALLVNRLAFRGTPVDARFLALREASQRLRGSVPGADPAGPRLPAHAQASYFLEATLAALSGAEAPRAAGRPGGLGWAERFQPTTRGHKGWPGPARPPADPDRSWRDGAQARHEWAEAREAWRRGLQRITRVDTLAAVYDLVAQAQRERLGERAELAATFPDSLLMRRLVDDAAHSAQRLDLHLGALEAPQLWPGLRQLFAIAASRSGPEGMVQGLLTRVPDRALRRLSLWWLEALERSDTQGRQAWLAREPAMPLVRHLLGLARHGRPGAATRVRRFPDLANHLYRWINLLGMRAGLEMLGEIEEALPGLSALAEAACREGLAHAALAPPLPGGRAAQDRERLGPDSVIYRAWGAHPQAGELVLDPPAFRRLHEALLIRALAEHRPRAALAALEGLHRLLEVTSTDRGAYLMRGHRQGIAAQAREALERAIAGVQVHPPWDEAARTEAAHLRRRLGRLLQALIPLGGLTARGSGLLEG